MFKLTESTKKKISEAKELNDIYNEAFLDLYNYLNNLAIDKSKTIRYNLSIDFKINLIKDAIKCLNASINVYKNEWLNKVKGRLSIRLLIVFIFIAIKKISKKIDCPDKAVDFFNLDNMYATISSHVSYISKCKGLEKYTEEDIKTITDKWQVLLSKASDLSTYLNQTWE